MDTRNCIILVVLDGVGDLPSPELNKKTPLEAARMKNLESILANASAGTLYPIGIGIAPESDAAIMSLLGYDIAHDYNGRGPLEAYGAGMEMTDDTLALRCNFATIDKNKEIIDRRAGRNVTRDDAISLQYEINNIRLGDARMMFKATVGHRGVLIIDNADQKLSANISNADVEYVKSGTISVASKSESRRLPEVEALDDSEPSIYTAMLLNKIIGRIIEKLKDAKANANRVKAGKLPANVLLMRDAGLGLPKLKRFGEKYGLNAAFIADMPVERGIAKLSGMQELPLEAELPNSAKYKSMGEIIKQNYKSFDLIYTHIKGPDEPGHDGNAILKRNVLEEIDNLFFSQLKEIIGDVTVCVTGDHSTPCIMKRHSADPVPLAIKSADPKKNKEAVTFSESGVKNGSLGTVEGGRLIELLLKYR